MLSQPDLIDRVRATCISEEISTDAFAVTKILRELKPGIPKLELLELTEEVLAEFHGLGPIDELLRTPGVTDVLINSHCDVWVDSGNGLARTGISWKSETDLRNFATRLAGVANRRLDESHPFVDLRLPNGARFHAVIPPLSIAGTKISIRIPQPESLTFDDLISKGMFSQDCAAILRALISNQVSFLISGGTGSGKTTLLSALLGLIPATQRILIIEDSTELFVHHPHAVSLQARDANVEGIGEVPLQSLVRQSLRMRPDRLVIGEVRGVEVVDFLNALNTGHSGSASTIHANSAESVPTRIEALGLIAGMPREAIHAQLINAIQVVIELARDSSGNRTISQIAILRIERDKVIALPAIKCRDRLDPDLGYSDLMEMIS